VPVTRWGYAFHAVTCTLSGKMEITLTP